MEGFLHSLGVLTLLLRLDKLALCGRFISFTIAFRLDKGDEDKSKLLATFGRPLSP